MSAPNERGAAIALEAATTAAAHAELAALAEAIWRECYADLLAAAQIDTMLANGYSAAALADDQARRTRFTLARDHGRAIGFAAVSPDQSDPRTAWLDKLYVHADARRANVGRRLFARALGEGRDFGARRLRLRVNRGNTRAITAYQRYGFIVEGADDKPIGHGFVMNDWIMGRDVDPDPVDQAARDDYASAAFNAASNAR